MHSATLFLLSSVLFFLPTYQGNFKDLIASLKGLSSQTTKSRNSIDSTSFASSTTTSSSIPPDLLDIPLCNMTEYSKLWDISNGRDGQVRICSRKKDLQANATAPAQFYIWKERSHRAPEFVNVQLEMSILAKLNKTGITPRIFCRDDSGFMMEQLPGLPLNLAAKHGHVQMTFENYLNITRQMVSIVQVLHKHRVLHLDLHLGNWILDAVNMRVWIIDFSCGRFKEKKTKHQIPLEGGAPELGKQFHGYSTKSDVYMLGNSMYQLYKYVHVYEDDNEDLLDLLEDMMEVSPSDRLSLHGVAKCLALFK